jgi:hypothetical protein
MFCLSGCEPVASHTVPWHLLPLNHWLDQASGCISTLGIQTGRGVCRLNRVQFDAMQVTMHTIWLKHRTLSREWRVCKDRPRRAALHGRKAGVSPDNNISISGSPPLRSRTILRFCKGVTESFVSPKNAVILGRKRNNGYDLEYAFSSSPLHVGQQQVIQLIMHLLTATSVSSLQHPQDLN